MLETGHSTVRSLYKSPIAPFNAICHAILGYTRDLGRGCEKIPKEASMRVCEGTCACADE